MSLDTYENLQLEIIDWSHRSDVDTRIETFITLTESEMFNNPIEILKIRGLEKRVTLVTSGKYLDLPEDYQALRGLRFLIDGEDGQIRYSSPEQMIRQPSTGRPTTFTITSQIEFNREPDQDYSIELQYYALPAILSDENQTNEVLVANPNIYLFGALSALYRWADQPQESQSYYAQFISAIKGSNKLYKKGRYGPTPAISVQGMTP